MKLALTCATAFLAAATTLLAGPPLSCHPFEIGDAKSLPWSGKPGDRWNALDASYDTSRLTADVLEIVKAKPPVIVHMETLRRATAYAMKDRRAGARLLAALNWRAEQAGAEPMALFDAGYLREAYRQVQLPAETDGLALMEKAAQNLPPDPEMEFALGFAYMDGEAHRPQSRAHLEKARSQAAANSAVARTFARNDWLLR